MAIRSGIAWASLHPSSAEHRSAGGLCRDRPRAPSASTRRGSLGCRHRDPLGNPARVERRDLRRRARPEAADPRNLNAPPPGRTRRGTTAAVVGTCSDMRRTSCIQGGDRHRRVAVGRPWASRHPAVPADQRRSNECCWCREGRSALATAVDGDDSALLVDNLSAAIVGDARGDRTLTSEGTTALLQGTYPSMNPTTRNQTPERTSTQESRANSGTTSVRRGPYRVKNDNPIPKTVRPTSALPP